MRDWTTNIDTTYYLIGSVMGPHPYPQMVRDFQKIIGVEAKRQLMDREGKLPDAVCACVGGGSNAMGMFYDFIPDTSVRLLGACLLYTSLVIHYILSADKTQHLPTRVSILCRNWT